MSPMGFLALPIIGLPIFAISWAVSTASHTLDGKKKNPTMAILGISSAIGACIAFSLTAIGLLIGQLKGGHAVGDPVVNAALGWLIALVVGFSADRILIRRNRQKADSNVSATS